MVKALRPACWIWLKRIEAGCSCSYEFIYTNISRGEYTSSEQRNHGQRDQRQSTVKPLPLLGREGNHGQAADLQQR